MIENPFNLQIGDCIIPYSTLTKNKVRLVPQIGGFFSNGEPVLEELQEVEIQEKKPWIGGIPFVVLQVALPLIMVRSCVEGANPPFLYFDTSMVSFIKITKEHQETWIKEYNRYYKETKLAVVPNNDDRGRPISEKTIVTADEKEQQGIERLLQMIQASGGPDIKLD